MCVQTQVHADPGGRPGKVKMPRIEDLSHLSDPFLIPWIIFQWYEIGLCNPENFRVLDLSNRAASGHQHQTVEHGVACREEMMSQCYAFENYEWGIMLLKI